MNRFTGAFQRVGQWFNQAAASTVGSIIHPRGAAGFFLLNRTSINYAREVKPDANSIVIACIRWVQRVYSEAPLMLQQWLPDKGEWEDHHRDPILSLLDKPNPFYSGTTLSKATVADYMLDGNAYWLIARNLAGQPVQLWWAPSSMMEPKGDPTDPKIFIDHYAYSPGEVPQKIRVEDVVHFRDGMDPQNIRKGLSPLKGLLREIFTDDEAANMTASLLRNMGVPGVVISPKAGSIQQDTAELMKASFTEKFTGDKRGEPLVLQGDSTVTQIGFSPEQMGGRGLRGVPEERITAVLGVNAAVVGLGAGLATTKVGATLREYREEAFESTIIPMYREMALELTCQLLPNFKDTKLWQLTHDLTKIRVLQEDELKRSERITNLVVQGLIRVAEGRRMLGFPVEDEHEIYLRPANLRQIPAGPLRVQTDSRTEALARFMASMEPFRVPTTLVCGPPGSGKTTYVSDRAERGDLIIDMDKLFVAISGQPVYDKPEALLPFALRARNAAEDRLTLDSEVRHAWVIKGAPEKAQREEMAKRGADVVVLAVPAEECLERIANDPERQGLDVPWEQLISDWWTKYEPIEEQTNESLALRWDAERLEAALETRLAEPDVDPQVVLQAHYLLVGETTCATLGVEIPDGLGETLLKEVGTRTPGDAVDAREETLRAQDVSRGMLFAEV